MKYQMVIRPKSMVSGWEVSQEVLSVRLCRKGISDEISLAQKNQAKERVSLIGEQRP